MAQRVQVLVVCDLHDGESPAEESVAFSLDGAGYEIDLCKKHASAMREAFAPYVGAGRKGRPGGRAARGGRGRRRGGSGRANEIREWARGQGIAVSERGRISSDVMAQYDAAQK